MQITCPGCGGTYSADAWMADGDIHPAIMLVAELPTEVSRRVFAYLSLFRGGRRKK